MKFFFFILASFMTIGNQALAGDQTATQDGESDMRKVQHVAEDIQNLTTIIELGKTKLADFKNTIVRKPDMEETGRLTWFFPVNGTEVEIVEDGKTFAMPMTLMLQISYNQNNVITMSEIILLDRFG